MLFRSPQFTTMNVIDGQAGLISYTSLIFYSLTIDNILNIIVLLILAGVTIATLTGDNGILKQAGKAKDKTTEAESIERVQVEVAGSYGLDGTIDKDQLNKNLGNIAGLKIGDNNFGGENIVKELPATVTLNGYEIVINSNGNVAKKKIGIGAVDISNAPIEYYGATVTGYTCTNSAGVNNWKIFYADSNNIYLIADDYIHYDYCPPSANKTICKNSDYRLSFNDVISDYSGSSNISDSRIQALNNDYFTKGYTSTSNNMKAVAYMLDTSVWSVFAGDNAEYAIGGPTVEMLMKSYSQKHNVDYRAQASSDTGYQISMDGGTSWANYYFGMLDTTDSLYVISNTDKANAMWLASPSAGGAIIVMHAHCTGVVGNYDSSNDNPGLRPLVCLNSSVKLEKTSEGTYRII